MTKRELQQFINQIVDKKTQQMVAPLVNEIKNQKKQIQQLNKIIKFNNQTNTTLPQQFNTNSNQSQQQTHETNFSDKTSINNMQFENHPLLNEMLNKNYKPLIKEANKRAQNLRNKNK